jgi:ATP-dependent exoDNAse (exonuclease V) alpha subunit
VRQIRQFDISRLNASQRLANNIFTHFATLPEEQQRQLLMRVEGQGGTGKSFLINAWHYSPHAIVVVAAPTGCAAHLIEGETVHSLFKIPAKNSMNDLNDTALQIVQNRFKDCRFLIIDEYSMVGCDLLAKIDKRLRQILGRPQDLFGNMSVLLIGDTFQLKPVKQRALWLEASASSSELSLQGKAIYNEFKIVVNLTEQVRQQGAEQEVFRGLLDRIRAGCAERTDWDVLEKRMHKPTGERERERIGNSVYIMSRKVDVQNENNRRLVQLAVADSRGRTCRIDSIDRPANVSRYMDDEDFGGLERSIILARGAKVMITSNIWVDKGIVNGTIGHVREIIFKENEGPPCMPICVIVELDRGYKGPSIDGLPYHVAIEPIRFTAVNERGVSVERYQLPLKVNLIFKLFKLFFLLFLCLFNRFAMHSLFTKYVFFNKF